MPPFVPKESLTSRVPDLTLLHKLTNIFLPICSSLLSPPRHLLGSPVDSAGLARAGSTRHPHLVCVCSYCWTVASQTLPSTT